MSETGNHVCPPFEVAEPSDSDRLLQLASTLLERAGVFPSQNERPGILQRAHGDLRHSPGWTIRSLVDMESPDCRGTIYEIDYYAHTVVIPGGQPDDVIVIERGVIGDITRPRAKGEAYEKPRSPYDGELKHITEELRRDQGQFRDTSKPRLG